jgi:FMN reductase
MASRLMPESAAVRDVSEPVAVVGLLASPHGGGSTATALQALLDGCAEAGAETTLFDLGRVAKRDSVLRALERSAAVVFASPTYRATHTSLLGSFLEQVERGGPSESSAPLRGKVTAVVMTAAAPEHFLATERLHYILSAFFAAQVLSPCLSFARSAFGAEGALTEDAHELARLHGRALVDLAVACRASKNISALAPLV